MREHLSFNLGWKFVRRDIPQAVSVEYPREELERWENVTLPHCPRLEPFGNSQVKTYQGVVMYRKHFVLPQNWEGKELFLEFEAVMGVTDVWLNGEKLHTKLADETPDCPGGEAHTNYGGYLPFVLCLTKNARFGGEENVLVVRADNRDNGQVPPGKPQGLLDFTYFGGIYRNTWLHVTEPVHITDALFENECAGGGIYVEYPTVTQALAQVKLKVHVRNSSVSPAKIRLGVRLMDRSGRLVQEQSSETELVPGHAVHIPAQFSVENPHLWDLEDPYLYKVETTLWEGELLLDSQETPIGIRSIQVDRSRGLLLNGKRTPMLTGVNRHQDYPYVGNAASASLQRRDAILFKSAGFNVVRAAHYPMSIDFVNACDELGILLFEATPGWQWYPVDAPEPFTSRVHNNIRQMVRRDRNHPCILAYEVVLNETYHVPYGYTRASAKVALSEHSDARISTESYGYDESEGANGIDREADFMYGIKNPLGKSEKALEFVREYADSWTESYGEFSSKRITRGVTKGCYPGGEAREVLKANGMLYSEPHSVANHYQKYAERPTYTGCAIWTGIDSRGMWSIMSACGIWDGFRLPKFAYYAYESQRPVQHNSMLELQGVATGPSLFIASYWTDSHPIVDRARDCEPIKELGSEDARFVPVYSNASRVILQVRRGGEVLWEETRTPLTSKEFAENGQAVDYLPHPPFLFQDVPYTPGSYLRAIGLDDSGAELIRKEVRTPGTPKRLRLWADTLGIHPVADGSDMLLVHAAVVDENGTVCCQADNRIHFAVSAGAKIIGDGDCLADANPVCAEAGIASVLIAIENQPGTVALTAYAGGLEQGRLNLPVLPAKTVQAPFTVLAQRPLLEGESSNLGQFSYQAQGEYEHVPLFYCRGEVYPRSFVCKDAALTFSLNGAYRRLFARAVSLQEETKFQILLDGVLRCQFQGEGIREIDLDIGGAHTLCLRISGKGAWLSPYVLEGLSAPDEGELRRNLAQGKSAWASVNPQDAALALGADTALGSDGSQGWLGAKWDGTPQSWQVDLGKLYALRNAMVHIGGEMGSDSTNFTYHVETSADAETWERQASSKRTSWANGTLDPFVAHSVRYVRVLFTEIEGVMSAGITKFEVYEDLGVDSVLEYNLKGLCAEGYDVVFDPAVTQYQLHGKSAPGQLTIRAMAFDENACVCIEGIPVDNAPGIRDISQASPVTVPVGADGTVTVTVTSANGKGKKSYQLHV